MLPNLLICLHDDVGISAIFRININILIFLFDVLFIYININMILEYEYQYMNMYMISNNIYIPSPFDLNKVLNTCHNDSHCKLYYSPLLVLEYMNISKKKTKFLS